MGVNLSVSLNDTIPPVHLVLLGDVELEDSLTLHIFKAPDGVFSADLVGPFSNHNIGATCTLDLDVTLFHAHLH